LQSRLIKKNDFCCIARHKVKEQKYQENKKRQKQ